jgi:hypothetical protein
VAPLSEHHSSLASIALSSLYCELTLRTLVAANSHTAPVLAGALLLGFGVISTAEQSRAHRMGYADAQEGAHSRTAFRNAEKKYKRYTHASSNSKRSRRSAFHPIILETLARNLMICDFLEESFQSPDHFSNVLFDTLSSCHPVIARQLVWRRRLKSYTRHCVRWRTSVLTRDVRVRYRTLKESYCW